MSEILKIKDLNKGAILKQGDITTLKYYLYDADEENIESIIGSPAEVVFIKDNQVYYRTNGTVNDLFICEFKIEEVLPPGVYHIEFLVDGRIFPSMHKPYFTLTPSSKGIDDAIIYTYGFEDFIIRAVDKLNERYVDVTKERLGLDKVLNIPQASKVEFDSFAQATTAQLAQTEQDIDALETNKMDKNTTDISVNQINKNKGKYDQTYMTDEFLQQMAGNTPINAIPENRGITTVKLDQNAVTNDKIRTFKKGKNLFNPFTLNVGVVPSQATGELSNQNPEYSTSDYTEVMANTTYTLKSQGIVCFYKSDYSFISANAGSGSPQTFTTPNETNFIRHSVWNGSIKTQQLEVGAVPTTYEPYRIYSKELDIPTMDLKPTTTEIEYENGRVSKVTEKLGNQIIKTTTLVYSKGAIQSVIEKTDDFSVTSTINRTGSRISGISKNVSKI